MPQTKLPNYDWRADGFNFIRGDFHLSVDRGWCEGSDDAKAWRWSAYHLDANGSIDDTYDEDSTAGGNGLTFEGAKNAAMAWLDAHEKSDLAVYSFAGLEPVGEELPL